MRAIVLSLTARASRRASDSGHNVVTRTGDPYLLAYPKHEVLFLFLLEISFKKRLIFSPVNPFLCAPRVSGPAHRFVPTLSLTQLSPPHVLAFPFYLGNHVG